MKINLFFVAFIFKVSLCFCQSDFAHLQQALLSKTPFSEDLEYLCDQIGGRVTGSEANKKAVDWAYKAFQNAGVDVLRQSFEMPTLWLANHTAVNVQNIPDFKPQVVAKCKSPPGNFKGQLISLGYGNANDFESKKELIKDQFILIDSDLCLDIDGLFNEYKHAAEVEILAREYGVQGVIFTSSRPRGLLYRFIPMDPVINPLPQLVMNREDAKRLFRLSQNQDIHLDLNINASVGGKFKSENVIGEIKGSVFPEEIILVGAHIDSWALGTGANDNGCNVAMLIDIARQMQQLGLKPKRTIRFALWNGEEQGYFGSWAYVKERSHELNNHILATSIDIGSGLITGFFTNGRSKLIPHLDRALNGLSAFGPFTHINAPIVGTDNFDFMMHGVPNLVGNHLPASYGINYHASSDTYDKVDLQTVKINSVITSAMLWYFANEEDVKLNKHGRKEVSQMIEDYNLEFTLRMFNVWQPWVDRKRGVVE